MKRLYAVNVISGLMKQAEPGRSSKDYQPDVPGVMRMCMQGNSLRMEA
jgi:hypothetical protein